MCFHFLLLWTSDCSLCRQHSVETKIMRERESSHLSNFPGKRNISASASSSKEWTASAGQSQSPSELLFHQDGHVSQFFDEWQFEVQGNGVIPTDQIHYIHENNCCWGAVDSRTHSVVMISRVYDVGAGVVCEASAFPVNFLANFLGLPLP